MKQILVKPQKRCVTPSVLKLLGVLHLDPINLLIHNEVKKIIKTLLRAKKQVDPINLFYHNEVKRNDKRTHLKTTKKLLVCITLKLPNN